MSLESAPIPFRFSEKKPLLIVSALVNGRGPLNFALDTGASLTVVSPGVARRARLPSDGARDKAIGAGGRLPVIFASVDSLEVGDVQAAGLEVAIMQMSPISRAIGLRLDGILGLNFLQKYRVTIDYPAGLVSFDASETNEVTRNA
jgi:predicted aspartyl protease